MRHTYVTHTTSSPQVPAAVEELVGGRWAPEDVLPLNGAPEEVRALREALIASRAAAAAKKAEKKRRNGKHAAAAPVDAAASTGAAEAASNGAAAGVAAAADARGRDGGDEGGEGGAAGGRGAKRAADAAAEAAAEQRARAKRFQAGEAVPAHARKAVWASIFTSSQPVVKETYGCRALSSRGV